MANTATQHNTTTHTHTNRKKTPSTKHRTQSTDTPGALGLLLSCSLAFLDVMQAVSLQRQGRVTCEGSPEAASTL